MGKLEPKGCMRERSRARLWESAPGSHYPGKGHTWHSSCITSGWGKKSPFVPEWALGRARGQESFPAGTRCREFIYLSVFIQPTAPIGYQAALASWLCSCWRCLGASLESFTATGTQKSQGKGANNPFLPSARGAERCHGKWECVWRKGEGRKWQRLSWVQGARG